MWMFNTVIIIISIFECFNRITSMVFTTFLIEFYRHNNCELIFCFSYCFSFCYLFSIFLNCYCEFCGTTFDFFIADVCCFTIIDFSFIWSFYSYFCNTIFYFCFIGFSINFELNNAVFYLFTIITAKYLSFNSTFFSRFCYKWINIYIRWFTFDTDSEFFRTAFVKIIS